jgi:hypothetical protein
MADTKLSHSVLFFHGGHPALREWGYAWCPLDLFIAV